MTTPQALGAIIKRTGIIKSEQRKGNFYGYNTEGYALTRQYGKRYTVNYYARMQMARETEVQREAFLKRETEALAKIKQTLADKGIKYEIQDGTLWINLEEKQEANA